MSNPIPSVPLRTPFFDGSGSPDGPDLVKKLGNLNRAWAVFFSDESAWASYGSHGQRVASASAAGVPDGALFIETDRAAIYESRFVVDAQAWVLVSARMSGLYGRRPSDLG